MAGGISDVHYRASFDASNFKRGANLTRKELRATRHAMREMETPAQRLSKEVTVLGAAYRKGGVPIDVYRSKLAQYTQAIDKANAKTSMFAGGFSRVRAGINSIGNIGAMLGIGVGVGGVGLGLRKIVNDTREFQEAMAGSTAIMGDVNENLRRDMEITAKAVGVNTKFSATEAAQAYFFLASAGMDAQQSIAAMPQVAKFAQAGMFDLARATDLATDAQSALGMTSKDPTQNLAGLTRVTDVLVKANTLANASVEQFSEALTNKAGASLRNLGKDIEEGVGVLAAFADQGIKGQEAGTALGIVLRDLTTKAIGNKDAFRAAGVQVFDTQGEMRNMADIVSDLERATAGLSDEARKQMFLDLGFSDKSLAFVDTLLGTSEKIRGYEEALRSAAGTTEEIAGKQIPEFSKMLNEASAILNTAAIEFGEPVLEMLVGWNSSVKGTTQEVGMLASMLGTVADVVYTINLAWQAQMLAVKGIMAPVSALSKFLGSEATWNEASMDAFNAVREDYDALMARFTDKTPSEKFKETIEDMQAAWRRSELSGVVQVDVTPTADIGLSDRERAEQAMFEQQHMEYMARQQQEQETIAKAEKQRLDDRKRMFDAAARAVDSARTPEQEYQDTLRELVQWLDIGAIKLDDFTRLKQNAADKLEKPIKVRFDEVGIEAAEAGTLDAALRAEAQRQRFAAMQRNEMLSQHRQAEIGALDQTVYAGLGFDVGANGVPMRREVTQTIDRIDSQEGIVLRNDNRESAEMVALLGRLVELQEQIASEDSIVVEELTL